MLPTRVWRGAAGLGGRRIVLVACGFDHTLALDQDGDVWAWGSGSCGELGQDDALDRETPTRVCARHFGRSRVTTLAAGAGHAAALTEDGALYTWGSSLNYAQAPAGLCHGDLHDRHVPTRVLDDAHGSPLVRIGRYRDLVLSSDRALAFAMSTHPRLAPSYMCAMLPELVQHIVSECRWCLRPEGQAIELPGLSRLLGARPRFAPVPEAEQA